VVEVSTSNPTPDPLSTQPGFDLNEARADRDRLAADLAGAAQEIARLMRELEFARSEAKSIYDTCKQIERERDQIIAERSARDARIRAEVAEEIARDLDEWTDIERQAFARSGSDLQAGAVRAFSIAASAAREAVTAPAAAPVVSAEGSGHPPPTTTPEGES
jgi:flagella basal body P-ring formation protein FlgA